MSVFRVALCEDDAPECKAIADLCDDILRAQSIAHELTTFSSADDLRAVLDRDPDAFDLLLLDIQMEGTTGLELAQALYDRGSHIPLAFITGCADYALAGYSAHPIHFILKPPTREKLEEVLAIALKRFGGQAVQFKKSRRTFAFQISDIRYIESQNHSVTVYLSGEAQSFPITMVEAERLLPSSRFFRCHNSFLVNMEWVERVERSELILRGGGSVPVSRRFYPSFQSAFVRYLNNEA